MKRLLLIAGILTAMAAVFVIQSAQAQEKQMTVKGGINIVTDTKNL